MTIQTNGPFNYDMIHDKAHFEIPLKREPGIQEYVNVTRHLKGHNEDTLTSDYLDVQFKRQQATPAAQPGKPLPPPPPKAMADDKSACARKQHGNRHRSRLGQEHCP